MKQFVFLSCALIALSAHQIPHVSVAQEIQASKHEHQSMGATSFYSFTPEPLSLEDKKKFRLDGNSEVTEKDLSEEDKGKFSGTFNSLPNEDNLPNFEFSVVHNSKGERGILSSIYLGQRNPFKRLNVCSMIASSK